MSLGTVYHKCYSFKNNIINTLKYVNRPYLTKINKNTNLNSESYALALNMYSCTYTLYNHLSFAYLNSYMLYLFFSYCRETMSSVRNFLRRQTDVEQQTTRHYQPHNLVNFERPLSEYDNLSTITSSSFPLSDIKFQFDVLPSVKMSNNNNNNSISSNSSSVHYNNINNNNNSNKETSPVQLTSNNIPQYENVFETVQMRNSLARKRDLEQVKSSEINGNKSAMNDARSTFFGLTHAQQQQHDKKPDTNDETDNVNVNNMQSDQINYINLVNNDSSDLNKISPSNSTSNANANQTDKMSATSSASNSSSTTITPQASPYRQNRVSRKGSEASNRSKSPKFMLPEIATNTPSQVYYKKKNFYFFIQ